VGEVIPATGKAPVSLASTFEDLEAFYGKAKEVAACLGAPLEKLERFAPQLSGFAAEVKAKREPITQQELALEFELIVCAFPNGKDEPDFVAIMVCAIAAMRPSIAAVQLARRELINKCKPLPAISEVREAIEEMTKFLDTVARRIHEFPVCLSFMKECRQLYPRPRVGRARARHKGPILTS